MGGCKFIVEILYFTISWVWIHSHPHPEALTLCILFCDLLSNFLCSQRWVRPFSLKGASSLFWGVHQTYPHGWEGEIAPPHLLNMKTILHSLRNEKYILQSELKENHLKIVFKCYLKEIYRHILLAD